MNALTHPLYWAVAGALLMAAEAIIPGGIVVFIGIGSMIVAASLQFGLISTWVGALTLWFISSLILLLAFRNVAQNMVGGDSHIDDTDEDAYLYGKEATVVETIGPATHVGRVSCLDSTWPAIADGSTLTPGTKVRIICRDNISLVVEKVKDDLRAKFKL
ncbi:NfeD family protein [Motilimonas cestriensis]|uniref:NfeD family protein n=1 Tax=Motilimonas cestriensis TaxID=2742685 RepID=A0ABS8WEG6_9GAMM|nr:NfeD family protein [Motilimonas cestriensis]MCE2595745.1 NfeD family protein [Motilimonas cestriensis]